MVEVSVRRPVASDDLESFRALATAVERELGHSVLNDDMRRLIDDLPERAALVQADDNGALVGAVFVATRPREPDVVTFALTVPRGETELEVARALLRAALDDVARRGVHGVQDVELTVFGADDDREALVASLGFVRHRSLLQLRLPLPLYEQPRWPDGVRVRPFVVGQDEDEWLAVNRRAFAHDPDQGTWGLDDLTAREAQAWFDPDGFLLALDDAGLAGFCWTKVHAPDPPGEPVALGELYVLGTDPDRRGTGLGRALAVAGLEYLHERRGTPAGMLFVDAENEAALGLYRSLGFVTSRVDRVYRCRR